MADRIRLLPEVVANQIAAGEVVNNPSSVVKEMMENAVDAGATSVTVNFRDGGKELIQIVDNGCGMSPIDARMAFDRHATSKIRQAEDIYSISTFGFRGEALASIAAVAEVEVRTRQARDEFGTSVEIGGGTFRDQKTITCPAGTQFLVRNLFYNTPARRRFLDKSTTESRRIKEEFRRVALCNPDRTFILFENDSPVYNLPPASLRQRIVGAIGKTIAGNLLEAGADTSLVRIEGFVGRPEAAKQNNPEQYLFVNGRYFKSQYFNKAILSAYDKLIPANVKPSYFIYLTIDPERIDVNVHPQKTEVRFEDGTALWQILAAAVREALGKQGARPMMDFDMDTSVEIPVHRRGIAYKSPEIRPNPDFNPFREKASDVRMGEGYQTAEFMHYPSAMDDGCAKGPQQADMSLIEFIEGDDAWQPTLEIEGMASFGRPVSIDGRYCAAAAGGDLMVVDVRRAWEAVLYERYTQTAASGGGVSQMLLFPEQAALSQQEADLAREYREELVQAGFGLKMNGDAVEIDAVPADFTDRAAGDLLRELLNTLAGPHDPAQARASRIAAAMARTGASHQSITDETLLAELLRELAACGQANYTPGGLPVAFRITRNEIIRRL